MSLRPQYQTAPTDFVVEIYDGISNNIPGNLIATSDVVSLSYQVSGFQTASFTFLNTVNQMSLKERLKI